MEIKIFMVIRNTSLKKELFIKVVEQASKISKKFYIVDHGSLDETKQIVEDLYDKLGLDLELINEEYVGTMDDMKAKHYKVLQNNFGKTRNFIFILDWDEVLDDSLINEIKELDYKHDVYMINRHTYLINQPIDRNSFLPLFFETNSVEINTFSKFHNLYKVRSNNVERLNGILHHYSYDSITDLLNKNIFYAKGEAEDLFESDSKIKNIKLFISFLFEGFKYFLYTLIYHQNFLTLEGWFYSLNWFVYKFYKYLFYLELKNARK